MKINVIVNTQLVFTDGDVTGRIVIDPDSLVNSIYYNSIFSSHDPMVVNMKQVVASVKSNHLSNGTDTNIYLTDGVVEKNFMMIDMHEAATLLGDYIGFSKTDSRFYNDEKFKELLDTIQKYSDIEFPSQMANIL